MFLVKVVLLPTFRSHSTPSRLSTLLRISIGHLHHWTLIHDSLLKTREDVDDDDMIPVIISRWPALLMMSRKSSI